ncbi:MAG: lysine transporter LysE [Pelagibacteraceae bacterium TMED136]|nr:MAG: lysine transporter LysE [Pelagibacteraceae bacterium TMED136]|tara:strand:- start:2884 stop:3486 length:603 start_codon:yes stop_codon:yes gene_type:complete
MISTELFVGLITYYFIMFMTPGPNNAMLAISGIKFGFKKTIPHMIGIPIGHFVQIISVCFGLGVLFQKFPEIQYILKFLGCAYLFYLSYKMFGSFSFQEQDSSSGRPMKIYEALLFQFLNPKAWIVALTVVTVFFPIEENFIKATLFVSLSAPLMCIFSVITWAGFGYSIRTFISNNKIKKFFEVMMAILLVITAVYILI